MQRLVADPQDDMARIYGGLRTSLGLRKVVVTPGALDAAGTSLAFHAQLTLRKHTYAYDGAVPLRRTPQGWRVASPAPPCTRAAERRAPAVAHGGHPRTPARPRGARSGGERRPLPEPAGPAGL
jgi:hypothetical protein